MYNEIYIPLTNILNICPSIIKIEIEAKQFNCLNL